MGITAIHLLNFCLAAPYSFRKRKLTQKSSRWPSWLRRETVTSSNLEIGCSTHPREISFLLHFSMKCITHDAKHAICVFLLPLLLILPFHLSVSYPCSLLLSHLISSSRIALRNFYSDPQCHPETPLTNRPKRSKVRVMPCL